MYSITNRFNSMVFFTSCTLVVLSLLNQATAWYSTNAVPTVDFKILSTDKFHHYKATHFNGGKTDWDQASFKFYLEADFEPVFNWNLKQLFLYVNVHHTHPTLNYTSDCIIYDRIIPRPDSPSEWAQASKLLLKNQRGEYTFRDIHKQLRAANVTFEIWVEIMPYVGYIWKQKVAEFQHTMPEVILVTDKGLQMQREIMYQQKTTITKELNQVKIPKKMQLKLLCTVSQKSFITNSQCNSKARKQVQSLIEYLPRRCKQQGYVERVEEINRSCDVSETLESIRQQKSRSVYLMQEYNRIKWRKTQDNYYH